MVLNILLSKQINLSVYLSIDEYCTHNNEQYSGCLIKIKEIWKIQQETRGLTSVK